MQLSTNDLKDDVKKVTETMEEAIRSFHHKYPGIQVDSIALTTTTQTVWTTDGPLESMFLKVDLKLFFPLLFLLFFSLPIFAKTVYVTKAGPTATIPQVNALSLIAGDSVLFNRGESFYGTLATKAGVYYGAYGSGLNPLLMGFNAITSWTSLGGGIYESTSAVSTLPTVTMVLVGGRQQAMGRYPNGRDNWIYATSVSSSTPPVTVKFNGSLPANFAGGHIVHRKMHWVVDHNLVQSNTSTSLVYTAMQYSTTRMPFQKGFGFFIENHPATLDQPGEWYYNPTTKKLRVFMGVSIMPVKVANVQFIVNAAKGAVIENLTLEGSNDHLVNVTADDVKIKSCELRYAGRSGVSVDFNIRQRLTVINSTIQYTNDMGIYTDYRGGDYMTFTGNTISDVGLISGTGGWGDFGQTAIHTSGSYSTISNNTLKRIGYTGIRYGNKVSSVVKNNFLDSICLTKDDGSGIYAYRGSSTLPASGNQVIGNIILNPIGNPYGTPEASGPRFDAYGIYMDENASGTLVEGNTVYGGKFGIFNHRPNNINYVNNTILNCEVPMTTWRAKDNYAITGMNFTGNIYVARRDKWRATNQWWETTGKNTIPSWGTSDKNYFVSGWTNTIVGSAPTFSTWVNHTLSQWQQSTVFGKRDLNSKYLVTNAVQRFEYNATNAPRIIILNRRYKDAKGNLYSSSVTLQPFSSVVLIEY